MKVLFVSSGNKKDFDIAPFIRVQGESLRNKGIEVEYFKVEGKGILGYLSNVRPLKALIKKSDFDLIHAHFSLSAWVAVLTLSKIPIVLSLMGTDAYGKVENNKKKRFYLNHFTILTLLIQPFVEKIISKSPNIERFVWQKKKSYMLPNGVDIEKFYQSKVDFKLKLGLKPDKKYVLFLGNTEDPRKNFNLLRMTKSKLEKMNVEILAPYPVQHEQVFEYLNSVDALIMCSFEEGSPNVVKEGMACNCKGVFTDVGDVRYLIEDTEGYEITEFDPIDFVSKVQKVLEMENCQGRKRLLELGLALPDVADNLVQIYYDSMEISKDKIK